MYLDPTLCSYNGIEVDVLSLGDADCIVVTQWNDSYPHRVLIDGGSGAAADGITTFLLGRRYLNFWAVLCSHPHNDHARGLIKVVRNPSFTFQNAWMHDIRNHLNADVLRRATRAQSGVQEVLETTRELAAAFASRQIPVREPFTGWKVAHWPDMVVLGPSLPFYRSVIEEFTNANTLAPVPTPLLRLDALAGRSSLSILGSNPRYSHLSSLLSPTRVPGPLIPLSGALANSSVQANPTTQPFNNTSVVLGVTFGVDKFLFTADAGTEALSNVGPEWNHLTYLGVPHHGSDGNLSKNDIERFCPTFAYISAKGDEIHPSRAIVSGLVKVGAQVASTHQNGHLWLRCGNVPTRPDYGPLKLMRGTGEPEPMFNLYQFLNGTKR